MKAILTLLGSTEDDVRTALKLASFGNWPQDGGDLLELLILMIDIKLAGIPLAPSDTSMNDPDLNFHSRDH